MSLKIKISKQNLASASESRPAKRRIQRIESDEEDDDVGSVHESYGSTSGRSQRKKARTLSRGASGDDDYAEGDEDVDVDIDGDLEDTRFLPEPQAPQRSLSPAAGTKRRLSSTGASSSKSRGKESKATKGKSSGKKSRRTVVWTDDEEEEFDDPDVAITDDDDFDPEPDYSSSKKAGKSKSGKPTGKGVGKGKGAKEKEEKEIVFRDERKLPAPVADPSKRPKGQDESAKTTLSLDMIDQSTLPPKRKLPTIKKNKPSTAGSTAPSTPSLPKPKPSTSVPEKPSSLLTPAPTSNQVGTRKPAGASADINLLDSNIYSELFKSAPGASTPNSGLNRKQKEEERRKELKRMRDEARAKREAEAKNSFDLQASPEKIERFVLHRLRHSTARFPNVLGATFKEMYDRTRAPPPPSAPPPAVTAEQR
ncbi:hypothetical protein C8Q77DRAFT_522216 [Trametes polyzona]|nr:hypothetical protein C8Q77DRAFT_522216 [Trametes polyzona]